jgi:hypothetical protein
VNKNFKKLFEQSYSKAIEECMQRGHQVKQIDAIFNSIVMGEFAELIVKECVQTLRDNTPVLDENESLEDWNKGYIRAMSDCEHHITEHFGVEE